jgi:hypothetical protein
MTALMEMRSSLERGRPQVIVPTLCLAERVKSVFLFVGWG